MSSKLSGIESAQIATIGAGRAVQRAQDAVSERPSSGSPAKDGSQDVQITGTARQLVDLEQRLRDLPVVNETRVSQVRTSIEQGTYTVRPEHIADQLMSLERALGSARDSGESALAEPGKDSK